MSAPQLFTTDNLSPVRATRALLHEMAASFAENEFSLKGKAPFMWLIGSGPRIVWIETPWENENEKMAAVYFLRKTAYALKADCYAFISEAWLAVYKEMPGPNYTPPGDLPKSERDDILYVLSVDRNEQAHSRWLVTQPRRGMNFLGPRVDAEDFTNTSGTMTSILKGWS